MTKPTVAGKGGNAKVIGRDSTAVGGDAGGSVYERGGHGGGAAVVGNNSKAFGGPGGRGGLGPGQDAGHANAIGDNMLVAGGEGGEAGQRDGRGGRGGRSGWEVFNARGDRPAEGLYKHLGIDLSKYGRGGDGANSTQCVARLAMVSTQVKIELTRYAKSARISDPDAMTSFLKEVNEFLKQEWHAWAISVVAGCFEFVDV